MRYFALLFLLLFAASVEKPQVLAQQPGIPKWATQSKTQDSQQKPSEAQVSFVPLRPETPVAQSEQTDPYNPKEDSLYRWYLRATIAGVIGALGALGVLWKQNRNLAEQIKVQRVALRQWVNTSDWKAVLTTSSKGERALSVSCAITNITKAPITLILVSLSSGDRFKADAGFPRNTLLLPDNPLRHSVRIPITDVQHAAYVAAGILLRIEGMILYTDALEETWTQGFRMTLAASPTGAFPGDYTHTLGRVQRVEMWEASSGRMFQNVEMPRSLWRKALNWYVAQVEAMKNGESE